MSGNIFDKALGRATLFRNKEHLRHSHQPTNLPHRDREIEQLTFNLVEALNGQIPSNMILYGVTGAGKTAVTSFVCNQLVEKGRQIDRDVFAITVNCRQIDTQYRVLTHLGNSMLEAHEVDEIPFTGWPTDRVLGELVRRMEKRAGVYIIVLDEIDHLVRKAGDDLLYNLTNLNSSLKAARCCVIGISNDLKFTDFLDPRVRSRLGQQDVVFNPYDADQLRDILVQRSSSALHPEALEDGVIGLCAALAAQEHGMPGALWTCFASRRKRRSTKAPTRWPSATSAQHNRRSRQIKSLPSCIHSRRSKSWFSLRFCSPSAPEHVVFRPEKSTTSTTRRATTWAKLPSPPVASPC